MKIQRLFKVQSSYVVYAFYIENELAYHHGIIAGIQFQFQTPNFDLTLQILQQCYNLN